MSLGQIWRDPVVAGETFPCQTLRVVLGVDNRATRTSARQTRGSRMPLRGLELLAVCRSAMADAD